MGPEMSPKMSGLPTLETLSQHRCFGGSMAFHRFQSQACKHPMSFAVFMPPHAGHRKLPVLYCLAGLTCTHETFLIKSGAAQVAAELGLILVAPDTSPRVTGIEGATGDWEFGEGASFYLDATQAPWCTHFRMASLLIDELPALVQAHYPADPSRRGVIGHSMGGHGALTLALKHPGHYQSVSAFAPIAAPASVPWGQKAFSRYLGAEPAAWAAHDACALLAAGHRLPGTLLVDQGLADPFLETQLRPDRLEQACAEAGQPLLLRRHAGYDHSYWFIQSFIGAHLEHHARAPT